MIRPLAWVILLLASFTLLSSIPLVVAPSSAQGEATWTLMMYIAADGDSSLPWEDDINEMEEAHESGRVTTLALVDPDGPGNSMLLRIRHDAQHLDDEVISEPIDDGGIVLGTGEVNTGAADTLQAFIEFAADSYPAERYVLFLWGHGGGWYGVCPDGEDVLELPELRAALSSSTATIGRPLDMVVVDACAEGVLEMMYEIREEVRWLVASEKGVPISGLPYDDVLDELMDDPDMSVENFGRAIADEYASWSWFFSSYSVNMSVFDLSAVGVLVDAVDNMAMHGIRFDRLFQSAFLSAYITAETYDMEHYVDLGDLLFEIIRRDVPLEIKKLGWEAMDAYLDVVAYSRTYSNPDPADGIRMPSASGAAIYFPSSDPSDARYAGLLISATSWDEFARLVRAEGVQQASEPGPEVTFDDLVEPQGRPDCITLTWQLNYSWHCAWVFRDTPNGLVFVTAFVSVGGEIIISGIVGSLTVSISAGDPYVVSSYEILNVSLYGTEEVEAVLVHPSTPMETNYELELVTGNGSFAFEFVDGRYVCSLVVPSDAEVMELAQVVVRDAETGHVVGVNWTTVLGSSFCVQVVVIEHHAGGDGLLLYLLLVLVPAAAILCASLALAVRQRRHA